AVLVQEAIEERQAQGEGGSAHHALQDSAAVGGTGKSAHGRGSCIRGSRARLRFNGPEIKKARGTADNTPVLERPIYGLCPNCGARLVTKPRPLISCSAPPSHRHPPAEPRP